MAQRSFSLFNDSSTTVSTRKGQGESETKKFLLIYFSLSIQKNIECFLKILEDDGIFDRYCSGSLQS